MRALGLRNSLYLLVAALFICLVSLFLYYSFCVRPVESDDARRVLLKPSTYNSRRLELLQILKRASMSDRTVIMTMVDEEWASSGSVLDIFLQSFRVGEGTQRLLNHLIIITLDSKAFKYCSSLHPHCIHPSIFAHYFGTKSKSITRRKHQKGFSWMRNNVLLEVLALGYNMIFTDADVMWLRNPLIHLNPILEVTISCNLSTDGQRDYLQDGGLFFLKANAIAFEFFRYWKLLQVQYPDSHVEESLCETLTRSQEIVEAYSFRIKYVNATYFGGLCRLNKDKLRDVYTIHANCCEDVRSKIHDLRLVLHDWMRFRDNTSEPVTLQWRAPQKCMR